MHNFNTDRVFETIQHTHSGSLLLEGTRTETSYLWSALWYTDDSLEYRVHSPMASTTLSYMTASQCVLCLAGLATRPGLPHSRTWPIKTGSTVFWPIGRRQTDLPIAPRAAFSVSHDQYKWALLLKCFL